MGKTKKRPRADFREALIDVLLPIGRMMVRGNLGVGNLILAAKQAYVRAAILQLFPAGSRINASRLSVATGMTRKEVSALVSQSASKEERSSGLKEQRALRVLRGWAIDPRFRTNQGSPATLVVRGERRSFSLLVKLYGGDVTPNSVLRELERMGAVRLTSSGRVALRTMRIHDKPTQRLAELARLFADLANTEGHLYKSGPAFFGFRDGVLGSADQAARFQRIFSNRASAVLEGADQWFAAQKQSAKSVKPALGSRVGIGVYLIRGNATERLETRKRKPASKASS